jgi:hypothetical protein
VPTDGSYSYPGLRLFDATGNQLDSGSYYPLEYSITTSGTYYIGVAGNGSYNPNIGGSGAAGGSSEYRLNLELITPTADAVGETFATALDTKLGPNAGEYTLASAKVGDGLYVGRDVDMFKFRASAGQVFQASTWLPTGGTPVPLILTMFDANGNYVWQGYAENSTTDQEFTITAHGTYYLAITGDPNYSFDPNVAGSGYYPGRHGDYALSIGLDRLTTSPVGGGGKPIFKVTGNGGIGKQVGFKDGYQYLDHVSVNAWLDAEGRAHGTMNWSYIWTYDSVPQRGGRRPGDPWHMRVDTLVVNGNTAHIEGVVVSAENRGGIGYRVSWDIVDNGSGKSDLLNGALLESGNFTVRAMGGNGKNLLADAEGPGTNAQPLTMDQVLPLLTEAVNRRQAVGADTDELRAVAIRIADLPDAQLGLAEEDSNVIWLDSNAAGWGWFVDVTPWDDSEFTTPDDQGEQDRMDLLAVLAHEMGHVLGLEHADEGLMAETLDTGVRQTLSVRQAADVGMPDDQGEKGRMDLLTAIAHEVEQLLGLDRAEDRAVSETLTAGTRRLAATSSHPMEPAVLDLVLAEPTESWAQPSAAWKPSADEDEDRLFDPLAALNKLMIKD